MALQLISFPIDQPVMPEERQIGRGICIESLESRLSSPAHQWLIGERRIGKTSVAKAALARLRKQGSVAIDIDLSNPRISNAEELAGEIARQGQAAGAGGAAADAWRLIALAKKQRGRARGLSKTLEQMGFESESQALAAVSGVLAEADGGAPGLDAVLRALALHARATEQRVYLLLDEVHLLAELEQAEKIVAQWCHEAECPIVFAFAGSEPSSAKALREAGRPLAAVGEEFELPEIAPDDWIPGLRERFVEAEVRIERPELEKIIQASACHPRRTMLVASRVNASASMQPDSVASPILVELAIRDARRDRAWN